MAAAQREVWTGAQLRRLLAERAGLHLSSASVSALLTRQPAQVKLETLAALCTALAAPPMTSSRSTPPRCPSPRRARRWPGKSRRPPADGRCPRCEPLPALRRCGAPVKFRDRDLCHACHRRAARSRAQAALPPLRLSPAPPPRGNLRDLRPPGRPPDGQDRCLQAVRRAAPRRRPWPLQPLQARRPGLALPLRRLNGSPAAGRPRLVAGADRVRRRPLPSRRRRRDCATPAASCWPTLQPTPGRSPTAPPSRTAPRLPKAGHWPRSSPATG